MRYPIVIPQGQENLLTGAIEVFPTGVGWKGEDIAIVKKDEEWRIKSEVWAMKDKVWNMKDEG